MARKRYTWARPAGSAWGGAARHRQEPGAAGYPPAWRVPLQRATQAVRRAIRRGGARIAQSKSNTSKIERFFLWVR
ncbi:hypothetical protein J2803_004727 [Paraburkholderia phenoliruptrix]|nr:hypothetical protein [Paraburkholderia phenoliruptrix]